MRSDYEVVWADLGFDFSPQTNNMTVLSEFRLTTNVAVGPTREGIVLYPPNTGGYLFLSDPSLPPNVSVGPIDYAIVLAQGRAVGAIALSDTLITLDSNIQSFETRSLYMNDPYSLFGIIPAGRQATFAGISSDASHSIGWSPHSTWVSFDNELELELELDPASAPASPHPEQIAYEPRSLVKELEATLKRASLDEAAFEIAKRAVKDARTLFESSPKNWKPSVMISDDGAVMLQSRKDDRGVLIILTGDGTASFSMKETGGQYQSPGQEFGLASGLPSDLVVAINQLSS